MNERVKKESYISNADDLPYIEPYPMKSAKKVSEFSTKNMLKQLTITGLIFSIIGLSLWGFYTVNTGQNYQTHRKIRQSIVDHPEFIPTAESVKIGSVGMQTLVADFYWLGAIQYIGSNAISADYKAYLGAMLELVTDLSPHFTYPYQIGLLLLPETNERYEKTTKQEQKKHVQEAIHLGEKGITQNCDLRKIEQIRKEYDLQKLFNNPALANPCTDPMIPYYLAYASYWNNNNPEQASFWYKVAGVHDTGPKGSQIMSAIMQGKTGNREKAIIMFLSLAENIDPNEKGLCRQLTGELRNLLTPAFANGAKLTPEFLKQVEKARSSAKKSL